MDVILALTTQDSVIVATSKAVVRGVTVLKATDDKTRHVTDHTLMAYSGEAGDAVQFAEYIQANIQLYNMRRDDDNSATLSPKAITSFTRGELSKALRSRKPYQTNLLIAGIDTANDNKPELWYVDYLAAAAKVPYAAHGYAAYYSLSTFDRWHREDLSLQDGLELLKKVLKELETRLPIDYKGVYVKIVDKDGIRQIDDF